MPTMHESLMRRAIELAQTHVPQVPFGALLVEIDSGTIVAEGWNRSRDNPTWHGEIDAINRCAADHGRLDWSRLALYTTAEPCPMCAGAVLWAGIGRVYYGTSIAYLKNSGWSQIDIALAEVVRRTPFARCQVTGGLLADECNRLFDAVEKGPFKR